MCLKKDVGWGDTFGASSLSECASELRNIFSSVVICQKHGKAREEDHKNLHSGPLCK